MSRVRFLTAITVGAVVLEEMERGSATHDVDPFLVWEWFVVESLVRSEGEATDLRGVPGSQMTRRALRDQGYLDAASYLKTPRIFGFHGVYKRLALRLGLIDTDLSPGPAAGVLLDAWAKGQRFQSFADTEPLREGWRRTVAKALGRSSPSTEKLFSLAAWDELAKGFTPSPIPSVERRALRQHLLEPGIRELGALPAVWEIFSKQDVDAWTERELHDLLGQQAPHWGTLVEAIHCYESFARTLLDGFDFMRAAAGEQAEHGLSLSALGTLEAFRNLTRSLGGDYRKAEAALAGLHGTLGSTVSLFRERFEVFTMSEASELPRLLVEHHERIQAAKPPEGKRSWFDRIEPTRIFLRHPYRLEQDWTPQPGMYVHPYRSRAIQSFHGDLQ
jgi:hypothetical protein